MDFFIASDIFIPENRYLYDLQNPKEPINKSRISILDFEDNCKMSAELWENFPRELLLPTFENLFWFYMKNRMFETLVGFLLIMRGSKTCKCPRPCFHKRQTDLVQTIFKKFMGWHTHKVTWVMRYRGICRLLTILIDLDDNLFLRESRLMDFKLHLYKNSACLHAYNRNIDATPIEEQPYISNLETYKYPMVINLGRTVYDKAMFLGHHHEGIVKATYFRFPCFFLSLEIIRKKDAYLLTNLLHYIYGKHTGVYFSFIDLPKYETVDVDDDEIETFKVYYEQPVIKSMVH